MSGYQRRILPVVLALSLFVVFAVIAAPAVVARRHVVASGGGVTVKGGLRLGSTVGQTAIATATEAGGRIVLRSGFWQPSHGVSCDGCSHDLPLRGPGLQGNVPNPFNPMTSIRFEVGHEAAAVRLRVFDVSGRLVRTLIDGQMPAGPGEIVWRGRTDQGAAVPSGLFFVTLDVAGHRFTQKMMLVR